MLNFTRIRKLYEERDRIDAEIAAEMRTQIPMGKNMTIEKGGNRFEVYVVAWGYGTRMKVKNPRTGKTYWIELYDVLNAYQ